MFTRLSILFCCFFCSYLNVNFNATEFLQEDVNYEKIYVEDQQISVYNGSIFINSGSSNPIKIKQLNSDEQGLFVLKAISPSKSVRKCPNGHLIVCSKCSGCVNSRGCNYGCHCWGYSCQKRTGNDSE